MESWKWQCRDHGRFTGKPHKFGDGRIVLTEFDTFPSPRKTTVYTCRRCGYASYSINDPFSDRLRILWQPVIEARATTPFYKQLEIEYKNTGKPIRLCTR